MKATLAPTALFLLLMSGPARSAELYDVALPDSVEVGEEQLLLNGMGLRKKAFIKVYVAGLYLPTRESDAGAILAADTARRTVMVFKFGVGAEKMCEAWDEGLEKNTRDPSEELATKFETLCSYMDDLDKGDQMMVTYLPGRGTDIEINGVSKGTIAGKDFADALFACWIGPSPPGEELKRGLLGS